MIVVVGAYTVTAMIVAGFLLDGTLVPDAWLFFDMATPTLAQTSKFIGAGVVIVAVAAVARHKLAENTRSADAKSVDVGSSALAAVSYRLLEGEDAVIEAARNAQTHDFGGELVLTFEDGARHFVSWVSVPVQYAIGVADQTHFRRDARLTEFDVSDSGMWTALIGKSLSLQYVVADNQALSIASADDHVLVCAYERGAWWADELTICKQLPAPYGAGA